MDTQKPTENEYRVLARKYRPHDFTTLIGQDALVRTLTNALDTGRIAHGFVLTGIRGVGKTTTARILARALNYGDRQKDKPTTDMPEITDQCRQIIEGRHVDVIEMDAASNSGVDNIRDLIDGVRYAPTSARYKVYIIDEVHMLSTAAFNALLKTLEEPPPHAKFIFATTEIRKVPITILSRCQRFDLRRVEIETLITHFQKIAEMENVTLDDEAVRLIARAADGSVRDGLSLMDQAIAISATQNNDQTPDKIHVTADKVRAMLALADRAMILDMFDALMHGQAEQTLDMAQKLYNAGSDPLTVTQDLIELTHLASKEKTIPNSLARAGLADHEQKILQNLCAKLSIPALSMTWQALLKGLGEVQSAPVPQQALEMLLIRLLYMTDMPSPDDLLKIIKNGGVQSSGTTGQTHHQNQGDTAPQTLMAAPAPVSLRVVQNSNTQAVSKPQEMPDNVTDTDTDPMANPENFRDLVNLFKQHGEHILYVNLYKFARLSHFETGRVELIADMSGLHGTGRKISQLLSKWTGTHWNIDIIPADRAQGKATQPCLHDEDVAHEQNIFNEVLTQPMLKNIMNQFPDAKLVALRPIESQIETAESQNDKDN